MRQKRWMASVFVVAVALGGCGFPAIKYTFGNNRAVATSHGEFVSGSSCIFRLFYWSFGVALPNKAIEDAVQRANQRDKLPKGQQYNALVDADLREVITSFGYCWEAAGYPARLDLGGDSAAPTDDGTDAANTGVK